MAHCTAQGKERKKRCLYYNLQKLNPPFLYNFQCSQHLHPLKTYWKKLAQVQHTRISENTQQMENAIKSTVSAAEVGYAHTCVLILLFLPYPSCYSQLQLLPVPTREKECHVSLDDETIMAVPDLSMAIPDAPWCTLPYEFPSICANLQAVPIVPSFILITHESEECHIYRRHAKLKGFKVKAKILTKTMKHLNATVGKLAKLGWVAVLGH